MNKNILVGLIVVLVIICLGEGYFINKERDEKIGLSFKIASLEQARAKPTGTGGNRPAPAMVIKGQTFADNPLSSKAFLIFPTTRALSSEAQTALTGWNIKKTPNADGSTQVDLIPSESADIKQSFIVKAGYKLYFVDLTSSDEKTGVEQNRGDDIGVLVDDKRIVQ